MDVEQPAGISLDKSRREDAHESGERNEPRRNPVYFRSECRFERFTGGESAVLDDTGRDAMRGGDLEAFCIRAVADHGRHRQPGVDQRAQVAAAPGNKDDYGHGPIIVSGRTQRSKSAPDT